MFKKQITIPILSHAEHAYKEMLPSERWAFYVLTIILALSMIVLAHNVYIKTTVLVPSAGGSITEGLIGAPRFVNPVLAISQTDKDLSGIIYASLMTIDDKGNLIPELAKNYTVSDDAKEYTFHLKESLAFHDGTPLTAEDVIFTIEKATQPNIKSPERANWEGITTTKIDEHTILFTLEKPYAQFLQNTLLGILPQEHWGALTADEFIFSNLNTKPIGSGPYRFVKSTHSNAGIPTRFDLSRFTDYVLGSPYIKEVSFNFYASKKLAEEAMANGAINLMSKALLIPKGVNNNTQKVYTATLPRIFAIFFNQDNNKSLKNITIRKVLRDVIDAEVLIDEILDGDAQAIYSPILQNTSLVSNAERTSALLSTIEAREKIEEEGWKIDEIDGFYHKDGKILSLSLATANSKELKDIATYISNIWQSIGVKVTIKVFEAGNLAQSVLRTREYDALFFGEIMGTDPDPYAFWHSSQRSDPGLNIANYSNSKVDDLLVKARQTIDRESRSEIYSKVALEINKDVPAIFLYAPHFTYITDKNLFGITLAPMIEPHDRLTSIHLWHTNTKRLWHF